MKGRTQTNAADSWIRRLRPHIERCGYRPSLLREHYRFGDTEVPLVGFAQEPFDARSACIALANSIGQPIESVASYRELGTPIVFRPRSDDLLEWWSQGSSIPVLKEEIPLSRLTLFFKQHQDGFAPEVVYRAKTRGRLAKTYQLDFVDVGLMPLVEQEIGERLARLVERVLVPLREQAGWKNPTPSQARMLVRHTFWLLAGKILRDKQVPRFQHLDLNDAEETLARVRAHYGALQLETDARERIPSTALGRAAGEIAKFASLAHVTTEALAEVYESSLITPETRRALGVHSTPPWLVDYILWRLEPWIKELQPNRRTILEPACGQAAFLTAGMRLLRELLPPQMSGTGRKQYLRNHLLGIEVDPFALELARLSLTLADIPYPNGWKLSNQSMFSGNLLERTARNASIFLANPPFEDFKKPERASIKPVLLNKAAEMLRRVLLSLPTYAVFGVIVPRGFLDVKGASSVREVLLRHFQMEEVILFPDKVFRFSDMECAVLLGRRLRAGTPANGELRCRWVRERSIDQFRRSYSADERTIPQATLTESASFSLLVPQLGEVWESLRHLPTLGTIARAGEGLSFKRSDVLPPGISTYSSEPFPNAVKGYVRLGSKLQLHGRPHEMYMNLSPEAVAVRRSGADVGKPQVLMNHARVTRGPWRIKAFLDPQGHPCTNNFNTIRPKDELLPLHYLWALLNSPISNAYLYTHSWRRHNLPGVVESIPIPEVPVSSQDIAVISHIAEEYSEVRATTGSTPEAGDKQLEHWKRILLRLDAEVLRLYSLAPRLERKLLDLFAGYPREGVPFNFRAYYPAEFRPCFSLHDYLSVEYQRSTAGALLERPQQEAPDHVRAALNRAEQDFEE